MAVCSCFPVSAQEWESIDPDLRNVRGICYLPVYPSREGAVDYHGVASSTAMWFEYDAHSQAIPRGGRPPRGTAGHVWEQLGWIKRLGVNTIRVWLSYPLWQYFDSYPTGPTNEYVDRVRHFVGLCESRFLRVIPVLWDGVELGPVDYSDPIGASMRSEWHANPDPAAIPAWLATSPTLRGTLAERYIADMVGAFSQSRALLMWDVMNEPPLDATSGQFVQATLALIKAQAPADATAVALPWAEDRHPFVGAVARDPNLDVLGLHAYGHTRANIEAAVWDATHVSDGAAGFVAKPVIATEIGKPGWALAYENALDFATGVPRPDLGVGERGIGCTPWTAMVGWEGGRYPFKQTDGLFFGDGLVRDRGEAMAFVDVALAQGISGGGLFTQTELVEWQGPGRVEQDIPRYADDWGYLVNRVWEPVELWRTMTWEEFRVTASVFRMVSVFLHVGPLMSAQNPINDPAIIGNVISPHDLWVITWCTNHLWTEEWQLGPELTPIMSWILGEPFDPVNNATHRATIAIALLDLWRNSLLPYIAFRKGPYVADPR